MSTTTNIQFLPPDLGRPSTKAIDITCQALSGTARGWRSPGYSAFDLLTNVTTSHDKLMNMCFHPFLGKHLLETAVSDRYTRVTPHGTSMESHQHFILQVSIGT